MRNLAIVLLAAGVWTARGADVAQWIEAQGGEVVRGPDGSIVEVSLARTWATDSDVERVAEIAGLRRLDLSFTYVTDRGIERLPQLQQLEELRRHQQRGGASPTALCHRSESLGW